MADRGPHEASTSFFCGPQINLENNVIHLKKNVLVVLILRDFVRKPNTAKESVSQYTLAVVMPAVPSKL